MADAIAEAFVTLRPDVSAFGRDVERGLSSQTARIAGAAATAMGAAIEGLARGQQESTQAIERMSAATGMQSSELRGLATDLSNATFPLDDVIALMEHGTQAGIEGAGNLRQYANFWDMVGDATGSSGPKLAEGAAGLRAVGIAAGEEGEALNAFGFITEHTTGSVDDFLTFLDRSGPELREFGLDVDSSAAILGAMEHELGLTARTARQEFRTAVRESDGDLGTLLSTLGLTEEQYRDMRGEVDASGGVIERNAAIVAASMTPLQEWKSRLDDLIFAHGETIGSLANFAPALLVVGSATALAGSALKGMRAGLTATRTAMVATGVAARATWIAISGPVGIAIAAIAAVVAAGVLLWRNWDTIQERASQLAAWMLDRFTDIWDGITGTVTRIKHWLLDHWEQIVAGVLAVVFPPGAGLFLLITNFDAVTEQVFAAVSWLRDRVVEQFTALKDGAIGRVEDLLGFVSEVPQRITDALGDLGRLLWDAGRDVFQGFIDGMGSMHRAIANQAKQMASAAWDSVKDFFKIWSPSRLMVDAGRNVGEGFALGIEDEVARVAGAMDGLARAGAISGPDVAAASLLSRRGGGQSTARAGATPTIQRVTVQLGSRALGDIWVEGRVVAERTGRA